MPRVTLCLIVTAALLLAPNVAFGFVICSGIAPPILVTTALVGFFAIFHGNAHGNEMPDGRLWCPL
jgi:urease accessory protein